MEKVKAEVIKTEENKRMNDKKENFLKANNSARTIFEIVHLSRNPETPMYLLLGKLIQVMVLKCTRFLWPVRIYTAESFLKANV